MNRTTGVLGLSLVLLLALAALFLRIPVAADHSPGLAPAPALAPSQGGKLAAPTLDSPLAAPRQEAVQTGLSLPKDELYEKATLGLRLREGRHVRVLDASSREPLPHALVTWIDGAELLGAEVAKVVHEMRCNVLAEQEPERYAHSEGTTYIADEQGELYLPPKLGLAMGRSGNLWLLQELRDDPSVPCELALLPDTSLDVKLVDYLSQPVGGIAIELLEKRGVSPSVWIYTTTDEANGTAKLPHFGAKMEAIAAGLLPLTGSDGSFFLGAIVHTPEPFFLEIDKHAPPTGLIEWTLPATGSIEISVTFPDGTLVPDKDLFTDLLQTRVDETRFPGEYVNMTINLPRAEGKGWTRYSHVGLGMEFEAPVYSRSSGIDGDLLIKGPTFAGESVAVNLQVPYSYPSLSFTILDQNGEPLPEGKSLVVSIATKDGKQEYDRKTHPPVRPGSTCRIKSDGYPFMTDADQVTLTVGLHKDPTQLTDEITFTPAFVDGNMDLGQLRMSALPVVAAGRVLDPSGSPLPRATVTATPLQQQPNGDWSRDRSLKKVYIDTDAEGHFRLFDTASWPSPMPSIRLHARHPKFELAKTDVLSAGAEAVEIRLGDCGALAGSVLCSPGVEPNSLRISIVQSRDGDGAIGKSMTHSITPLRDGTFVASNLAPGTYTVAIAVRGQVEPLRSYEEVLILPTEMNRDSRLQQVDLLELRRVTLSVVDPLGRPIPEGTIALRAQASPDSDEGWASFGFFDGKKTITLGAGPFDMSADAQRYSTTKAFGFTENTTVTLVPWREVTLSVDLEAMALQPGWRLYYWLEKPDSEARYESIAWQETFDAAGLAHLWVSQGGTWQVNLELEAPSGLSEAIGGGPMLISIAEDKQQQSIELAPDLAAWEAAAKALGERASSEE